MFFSDLASPILFLRCLLVCVRFSFFSTVTRDWLERSYLK